MRHTDRLPDTRNGAGLLWNLHGTHVLPIRDNGPIAQPKRIDGQMGMVEDELVKDAQTREGTEETAIVREHDGQVELGIPSLIKGTEMEENLIETYKTAREDENSPLPELDGTFTYGATQQVPDGMPTKEADAGHLTGYTYEVTDDVSQELMNDLSVDLYADDLLDGDLAVYDLEHMEDDNVIHFDRPVALLDPQDDEIAVYRGGELEYNGDVAGFQDFLEDEYDWDMSDIETPATAKVQARLDAYGDELGEQTSETLVDDAYMDGIAQIGRAFEEMPEP